MKSKPYGLPDFLKFYPACGMPAPLDQVDLQLKQAIAQRFKEIRETLGITQEALAHSSGRDKQSYNKNERGKGATIYIINKFCIENGISLKDFFDSPIFNVKKGKN